jgi:hypothetical protein
MYLEDNRVGVEATAERRRHVGVIRVGRPTNDGWEGYKETEREQLAQRATC